MAQELLQGENVARGSIASTVVNFAKASFYDLQWNGLLSTGAVLDQVLGMPDFVGRF